MGYSIRDKCQKLIDLGYDEDTIVSALNMKHKQYRKLIGEKFDTLTPGAALELNMYDAELTEARAAELYYVDCADIRRARNGVIRPEATDEAVMAWLLTEHAKTRKELFASLRSKFGLRKDKALAVLKRLGYVADGTKTRCKYNMVVSLLNKGVPAKDIPAVVKCTRSYVTMITKDLGHEPQACKRPDNWPEILAFAAEHSTAEASRRFSVSRQAILYQKKKVVCADTNL